MQSNRAASDGWLAVVIGYTCAAVVDARCCVRLNAVEVGVVILAACGAAWCRMTVCHRECDRANSPWEG